MADKQINELTVATDISDVTTFPANNNTPTYEAQQVSVGQIANFIGARANAMHNIGDVFTNKSSKVELNPGCVPLWTGEYITNAKNIYPEFYNYLKVQNPGICISKQEYDTQVSSGECRYFVIDEEDGSIRFPKYNFVEPDYPYIYVFNASIPQSTSQGAEYTAALVSKVSKAGDTMTGGLTVNSNVVANKFISNLTGSNFEMAQAESGINVISNIYQNTEIRTSGTLKKATGFTNDKKFEILDESMKAVANGVASLDSNGKIPAEQMPLSVTIRVWEE